MERLSVGDRQYLEYPIREETTFDNPGYLGDPNCNQEGTTNEAADALRMIKREDLYRKESDTESDILSQDSTYYPYRTQAHSEEELSNLVPLDRYTEEQQRDRESYPEQEWNNTFDGSHHKNEGSGHRSKNGPGAIIQIQGSILWIEG